MKILFYGLIFTVALVLQSTVFAVFPILGAYPELVLMVVIIFSIINGGAKGAKLGFAGGLLQDMLFGRLIGLNAVVMMIVGFGAGVLAQRLYKENYVIPFLSVLLGTWVGQFLYLLGMMLFGLAVPWDITVLSVIFGSGLYNGLITLLVYKPFVYLNSRIIYWDELVKRAG
ncbi:MAG: rod shape-determining protein MreD [Firmicutes bacterium]|nr:rod shape-determining protein MreD [Bacillota bacterium]